MAKHPDAFQLAGDPHPLPFLHWHSAAPIAAFQGIVRVYFSSGPAYDFQTWIVGGERHWQAIGPA